jgi:C-terminal processing protease CtpA/Prc
MRFEFVKTMKKLLYLLIVLIAILGSCKKEISAPEVTPVMARDSLYYLMNSVYYWYNLMPSVTKENYSDPYTLMDAMMYKELDRWSFVADYDKFNAAMNGSFVGHGIRIGLDENDKVRIVLIYNKSPLYALGVRRGWIIKNVNNIDLAPIIIAQDSAAYNDALGASSTSVTNTFLFQKPDGTDITISSRKASFTINSVILYDTLHLSTGITGHLVFDSFIIPSEKELQTAFAFFNLYGVKDLIVDLRYNLGGYLYIAQELASYIIGNGYATANFATIEYNDNYQDYNQTFKFLTTSYPLALTKVVFITTRSTASASEDVMNGLSPFLTIVSVGDTTMGKPVGMLGFPCGKKYIFSPIVSKVTNSLDIGDFYEGFAPDKIAADDLAHDFDDRQEICLNEAIHYIETGSFSNKSVSGFKRSAQFSEKPSWMNNAFVNGK